MRAVAGSGGERRRSGGAMGLCCCKDWRGHLRAPKGNSGRARAPRCSRGHNSCGGPQSLRPPAPTQLCRGSRPLTLAGASPNSGTCGGSQGYARSSAAAQRGDPDGRWARGQVRQAHCCIGPGRGWGTEEHSSSWRVPDTASQTSARDASAA